MTVSSLVIGNEQKLQTAPDAAASSSSSSPFFEILVIDRLCESSLKSLRMNSSFLETTTTRHFFLEGDEQADDVADVVVDLISVVVVAAESSSPNVLFSPMPSKERWRVDFLVGVVGAENDIFFLFFLLVGFGVLARWERKKSE
jgi:hypothetical protein